MRRRRGGKEDKENWGGGGRGGKGGGRGGVEKIVRGRWWRKKGVDEEKGKERMRKNRR